MAGLLSTRTCCRFTARTFLHTVCFNRPMNYPIAVPFHHRVNLFSTTIKIKDDDPTTMSSGGAGFSRSRTKLSPEKRLERFNQLFEFVYQRLGRRPALKTPQVRQSAWTHLFGLATTPEQLEKVTELFPKWGDSRRAFDAHHAELFVRRCEELQCPGLALKVFGDHSKYGLALSLPAARGLLHALHVKYPLADTLATAALFRAHGLPAPSEDLVSCAMLVSACFNCEHQQRKRTVGEAISGSRYGGNALRVAQALVPNLRRLLSEEGPVRVPDDVKERRARASERPKVWLMRTLGKIEKALAAKESEGGWEWLRDWRIRSGHVQSSA